jgi:calmodulin
MKTTAIGEATEAELKVAFQGFDKDGDGYITEDELRDTLRVIGHLLEYDEIRMLMLTADKDGDEHINFPEFCSLMKGLGQKEQEDIIQGPVSCEDEMRAAFTLLDLDGDGFISRHELEGCLHGKGEALTKTQIDEMMRAADVDGDGRLSFMEYMVLMRGLDPASDANAEITDEEIAHIFQEFDLNEDGRMTAEELGYAMKSLGRHLNAEEVCTTEFLKFLKSLV